MDNIKQYFIRSTVNKVVESVDANDAIDVDINCNEPQQKVENEITQSRSQSTNKSRVEDSIANFIRKIQSLEEENVRLSSIIEDKNITIKDSSEIVPDFAAKKILLLTERVQELTSELQSMKSSACGDNEKSNDFTIEVKELTDKLSQSNKKICNYRNQIMQLKSDLQVTQNALSNEIGDPAITQAVLSGTGSSNSRGRAQQILMLQQKVNELQQKLNEFQAKPNNDLKNKLENNSSVIIRQMEKSRKEVTDKALKDTQSKVNELTKSLDVWKSRSKAMDVEMTVLRVQIQKLMSKAEFDNKIIEQLKTESINNNNTHQLKTSDSILKLEESIRSLQSKADKAQQIIDQQSSYLKERDIKIAHLESKLQDYNEKEIILNQQMAAIDLTDPTEIIIKKFNKLENQQLMDLLCVAHNEICKKVKIVDDFKSKFLMEKQKLQKLESKIKLYGSSTPSKQKSNNVSYHLKHELNQNEKLAELQNKMELAEEENAALKNSLDTLIMINRENVNSFSKAMKNIKQQLFLNEKL